VIWRPNQIFDKFGREGDVPQGKSPFRFGTKGTEKTQRASSVGVKLSDAAVCLVTNIASHEIKIWALPRRRFSLRFAHGHILPAARHQIHR
jgi:hypothetical protein